MAAASRDARPKTTYNFSAAQAEIRLKKPQIEIEFGADVEPVIVDPPALWPDEAHTHARKGEGHDALLLIMGAEQYDRWVENGGTWGIFNEIVADHQKASLEKSGASKTS